MVRGVPGGVGTSMMITPLKWLRIIPKVQNNFHINDSLGSFVLVMINK